MKVRIETTTNQREYHILRCIDQDPYLEEYGCCRKHKRGYRGYKKSRMMWPERKRMYRTWKHTRKTQWKLMKNKKNTGKF